MTMQPSRGRSPSPPSLPRDDDRGDNDGENDVEEAAPASSPHALDPMPASVLIAEEIRRRDALGRLGGLRSGCGQIDEHVLRGGFDRGCVVGVSAEEGEEGEQEDTGALLALQVLAHSLCSGAARRGLLVVPPAAGAMPRLLRDVVAAEVAERRGVQDDDDDDNAQARVRVCLDRVMISPVFDLDGLWEALGELDATTTTATRADSDAVAAAAAYTPSSASSSLSSVLEIGDSQDDVDADEGRTGPPPASQDPPRQKLPDIIVVTHFSSLLTSLFTHRDRAAAHAALQLLSSHLRCLSRTLASSPLILLLNSTSSSSFSSSNALAKAAYDATKLPQQQQDPTLRSIFNPPPLCIPGYSSGSRRNKPTFGLVFTQFLDIHLLCTRIPRSCADAEALYAASATTSSSLVLPPKPPRFVTVVEVLLDEVGVWQGRTGERQSREQRWAAVDTAGCRIRDAFGVEDGSRRPRQHEQVGTGHGCPRV